MDMYVPVCDSIGFVNNQLTDYMTVCIKVIMHESHESSVYENSTGNEPFTQTRLWAKHGELFSVRASHVKTLLESIGRCHTYKYIYIYI